MILIEIKQILKFESFEYSRHLSKIISKLSRTPELFDANKDIVSISNHSIMLSLSFHSQINVDSFSKST